MLNASPDIRQQIAQTGELHPRVGSRHSPIQAVLLTSAEIDHVAGLLTLRERQAFTLFATETTLDTLALNPIFDALAPELVARRPVRLGETFAPVPGLSATVFAVAGKTPLWRESHDYAAEDDPDAAIGVVLAAAGKQIAFVPGCARIDDDLLGRIAGVDALLFDGTVLHDDELVRAGVSEKTGRRMGHMPMAGDNGSIAGLAEIRVPRRIFVHINNTNPVLVENSDERCFVEQSGWIVAHDGLRIFP